MLVTTTNPGVCVASKRRGGMALYMALLVALIIFVPGLRETILDWLIQLGDVLKDLIPFRS